LPGTASYSGIIGFTTRDPTVLAWPVGGRRMAGKPFDALPVVLGGWQYEAVSRLAQQATRAL
jgi:hypothetical protein